VPAKHPLEKTFQEMRVDY